MLPPWKESYDQPRQHVKKQRHYVANKGLSSQSYDFSSSHAWMWELDYKESWVPKNWCFRTVVLEKTLESPLVCKEILLVHPKGDQSWIFIGRTDAEAESLIFWSPDAKNWLIRKDLDAGKDWRLDGITDSMDMSLSKLQWWTGRPGVLRFIGSQRVGHDWMTELNVPGNILFLALLMTAILIEGFPGGPSGKDHACQWRRLKRCGFNPLVGKILWRRKWQPTQVFSPGEFHGQKSLVGCIPWGCKQSDKTEQLTLSFWQM